MQTLEFSTFFLFYKFLGLCFKTQEFLMNIIHMLCQISAIEQTFVAARTFILTHCNTIVVVNVPPQILKRRVLLVAIRTYIVKVPDTHFVRNQPFLKFTLWLFIFFFQNEFSRMHFKMPLQLHFVSEREPTDIATQNIGLLRIMYFVMLFERLYVF